MVRQQRIILLMSLEAMQNITTLAKGVPIGGELDYLDDGTISATACTQSIPGHKKPGAVAGFIGGIHLAVRRHHHPAD